MSQNKFPDGWDENKVQTVLAHYEEQSPEEATAEDEAGVAASETVMNVPHDLVPQVRALIAKHHGEPFITSLKNKSSSIKSTT